MDPAALLREARRRSGLTQAALAERAGVARSVVSSYEQGHRSPGVQLLTRLLAAADCQLKVELEPLGADIDSAVQRALAMSPAERADRVAYSLTALATGLDGAPYVVTGLAAAALQGAPVDVPAVEVVVGNDDETLQRVCRWLCGQAMRIWDDETVRWVLVQPCPLLLRTFTPTKWADFFDAEFVIAVVEVSTVRPDVHVPVGETLVPAAGLWTIEDSDERVAALLTRTRERTRS